MTTPITLSVNGESHTLDVPPEMPLLWALRQTLGLTGTTFGCGMALCGACTVHVDGEVTRACVIPVGSLAGKAITTIEGVAGAGTEGTSDRERRVATAVQDAWVTLNVAQCGYCQAGQVMAAVALLRSTAAPTDADIDAAMRGNLCRCGAYPRIRAAIHAAAAALATPTLATPTRR